MQKSLYTLNCVWICMYAFSFDKTYICLGVSIVLMKIKFLFVLRNFILSLIASFYDFVDYMTFYTLCLMFTHDLFSWDYMSFYCYLSVDDHVIFMFSWIHSCFIPNLKDFILVFKIIIKLVRILHFSRVFQTCYIFKSYFWKPLPFKDGWLGDHALYA